MTRRSALLALISVSLACSGGEVTNVNELPTGNSPATPTNATPGTFAKGTVSIRGASYPYQVFVPKAYTATQKSPVILFIHGGNERGSDGVKQITGCFGPYVQAHTATFPAIVVFPQIPAGESFDLATRFDIVTASLDAVMAEYATDPKRVYLTGFSMGAGMGYELAYRDPTRYAAFAPVSGMLNDMGILGAASAQIVGSANAITAAHLKTMPIWVYHGDKDPLVPVSITRNLVQAFRDAGSTSIKYTEIAGGGHDCGPLYGDQGFFDWLYAQHR